MPAGMSHYSHQRFRCASITRDLRYDAAGPGAATHRPMLLEGRLQRLQASHYFQIIRLA